MRSFIALTMVITTLQACDFDGREPGGLDVGWSADAGADADTDATSEICRQQSTGLSADGDEVVFCDEAFAERPFVRPPSDRVDGDETTFFAALSAYGGPSSDRIVFTLRDGTELLILDATNQIPPAYTEYEILAQVAPGSRMPSHRGLFTVYEVHGKRMQATLNGLDVEVVQVIDVRPAILIRGNVLDGTIRVFEGLMAPPTGDFAAPYDWTIAKAFRLEVAEVAPEQVIFGGYVPTWNPNDPPLLDATISTITGALVNAHQSVTASDGSCLAALDAGTPNPIARLADANMTILRFPGMHGPGDEVLTIAPTSARTSPGDSPEGMGPTALLHPAGFIHTGSDARFSEVRLSPHGFPHNFEVLLRAVTGGVAEAGQPCQVRPANP